MKIGSGVESFEWMRATKCDQSERKQWEIGLKDGEEKEDDNCRETNKNMADDVWWVALTGDDSDTREKEREEGRQKGEPVTRIRTKIEK